MRPYQPNTGCFARPDHIPKWDNCYSFISSNSINLERKKLITTTPLTSKVGVVSFPFARLRTRSAASRSLVISISVKGILLDRKKPRALRQAGHQGVQYMMTFRSDGSFSPACSPCGSPSLLIRGGTATPSSAASSRKSTSLSGCSSISCTSTYRMIPILSIIKIARSDLPSARKTPKRCATCPWG